MNADRMNDERKQPDPETTIFVVDTLDARIHELASKPIELSRPQKLHDHLVYALRL